MPTIPGMLFSTLVALTAAFHPSLACEGEPHSCYGEPEHDVILTRNTTDTHGWLEGHTKEQNYGADWGDYVSFTRAMKQKARNLGVDLLLDLHDDAGPSDATWENVEYGLLTIGNHELYITEIAYETFSNFSNVYGDRHLTRLGIMAFGVLFDFTSNSNVSKVIKAASMVQESWFLEAVNCTKPIDLFVVIGDNPVRTTVSSSTFGTLFRAIRKTRPNVPIQAFGGRTHIRDFVVYDNKQRAWSIKSSNYTFTNPNGVINPTRSAILPVSTETASESLPSSTTPSDLWYARRYLDWNHLTFAYHAEGSQQYTTSFDTPKAFAVTSKITAARNKLHLTNLYGCAPQSYCQFCKPFLAGGNLFQLLQTALSTVFVNETRKHTPHLITISIGSVHFDLAKGRFTYDDSFIVSPFKDAFQFLADVPYEQASKVLDFLNSDTCVEPPLLYSSDRMHKRSKPKGRVISRHFTEVSLGYTTIDDFGDDGDDTIHAKIPSYTQPNDLQANASFPTDGSTSATVDLVFIGFIASYIVNALNQPVVGGNYSTSQVAYYMDKSFTTSSYLPAYAKIAWQETTPHCPVGAGIGSD
ncbi:hypothetical protein CC80DRAFT_524848 [Byssothecium circinans]|uniref:Putative 5'-nucleotidase C-terminal domain-containing protein n=1 Tax=Byssothecium circinans TaxID=147558 RepID=A0A6A5TZQ2_9PLEO|nr:hypothetical protein CC80DRAFT_524848 [Byssothecium circinans]